MQSSNALYYFGYGPIVNDLVRQRRGIETTEIRAACLSDYMLTFCIGGLANIVPRRGYEVHGLLMKLKSAKDWKLLHDYDAGSTPTVHNVFPYDAPDTPVRAQFVEFSEHVEDVVLDSPLEHLPQDRYLNLIAIGLRKYKVDDEFVDFQIMAVPYTAKRHAHEFERVPLLRKTLPRIKYRRYLQRCKKAEGTDIYFILGDGVFRLNQPDFKLPASRWLGRNGHGKPDATLFIHKTIVDPDIPLCDELSELTPLHFDWAENHIVELMELYNLSCNKVAILKRDDESLLSSFKQSMSRSSSASTEMCSSAESSTDFSSTFSLRRKISLTLQSSSATAARSTKGTENCDEEQRL